LAYEYNVRNIWIVNVGDLKPMEFPVSFFLDYAWDVNKWSEENLNDYYTQWAAKQFGQAYAKEIGGILEKYAQYASRRKPELLDVNTYSIENYNEAERVVKEWTYLESEADKINGLLASDYKDAYFELVLHPVKGLSNLHQLYVAVARNKYCADKSLDATNFWADKAKELYKNDSLLSLQYNQLNNGKWNHMMDQTHIGYTYWQQPDKQKMPEVKYISDTATETITTVAALAKTAEALIPGNSESNIFYKKNSYVSINAVHYTNKKEAADIQWKVIPDIGKDGDGITTFPVTVSTQSINTNTPYLEYDFYTYDTGVFKLYAYFSPTLNFHNDAKGSQYGISIDDEKPQIISINKNDNDVKTWEQWVANNIIIKSTNHTINKNGKHVIKFWMISPAVILQKIVVDFGGVKPAYLGPPETLFKNK
jgi:hypothetical protein